MEKLGLDLDEETQNDNKQANPQEARKQSIQRCIQSLVHACRCVDQTCPQPSCLKMKRVVSHTKVCKRKTNGGCPICKQLIALCCYHAKHCKEIKCLVPFCPNIKHKLKQQQLAQRFVFIVFFVKCFSDNNNLTESSRSNRVQQAELLRRRVAFMNNRSAAMGAAQTAAICGAQNQVPTVNLMPQMQGKNINPANQMGGPSMQNVQQQQQQQMMGSNMLGKGSMNINNPIMSPLNNMVNPMSSPANQMQQQHQQQQQQQMNTGSMMQGGNMNVNNPMSGNNQMNPGNMMNNNQMIGQMNMVSPMGNTGNQMQQIQQVKNKFTLIVFLFEMK